MGDIVGQCPNYSMSDGERAYALALNWTDDRQETHELVARLRKSARSMIEQPENWAAIKALAHELVEVDTVSGDRACQIVTDSIAQAKQGD